jgi:hypothetical protein
MIICSAPGTIEVTTPTPVRSNRELLINQACHAEAPWQFSALRKLHDLSTTPTASERNEDLIPAPSAFMFARIAVAQVTGITVPSPMVCPVSGGSLGMIWSLGSKQLEVIFDADQLGSYVLSNGDAIIEDGDIKMASTQPLHKALASFLRP